MKKQHIYFFRRLGLAIIVVVIGVIIYRSFFTSDEIRVVASIEEYNYQLESNQTKIFKKYYRELTKELEDSKVDEERYAELVSKLFIIDFYTLSNKVTNQDVGGIQFLHSSIQDNFKLKATDTVYKYVKSNIYGNRRQKLPIVKDVDIKSIENIVYEYSDTKDPSAYQVQVKISYRKDLGFDKEKKLVLVHENNKLVIVEVR